MRSCFSRNCWVSIEKIGNIICKYTWYITTSRDTMDEHEDFLRLFEKHSVPAGIVQKA